MPGENRAENESSEPTPCGCDHRADHAEPLSGMSVSGALVMGPPTAPPPTKRRRASDFIGAKPLHVITAAPTAARRNRGAKVLWSTRKDSPWMHRHCMT